MTGLENWEVIEQYLPRPFFWDDCRREVINKIIANINSTCQDEEEALAMLFWHSSFLEHPLSDKEITYCRTLLRMGRLIEEVKIDSVKMALEILGMPAEKMLLPRESLVKEVKRAYWILFNRLTGCSDGSLVNVREFLYIAKAYMYMAE